MVVVGGNRKISKCDLLWLMHVLLPKCLEFSFFGKRTYCRADKHTQREGIKKVNTLSHKNRVKAPSTLFVQSTFLWIFCVSGHVQGEVGVYKKPLRWKFYRITFWMNVLLFWRKLWNLSKLIHSVRIHS